TGAATLNVSGLGAKTIKKIAGAAKADLAANDIISGQPVHVAYDGTDMVLLSPTNLGTAAGKDTGTSGTKVPLLDGANTWSAPQVIDGTAATMLTVRQTDDGAGGGPNLVIDRGSSSPAASDV